MRLYVRQPNRECVVGFVDASSARGKTILGGALITEDGGAFFVHDACGQDLDWLPSAASNVINEAESLAASVWVSTFGPGIRGQDVLLFIDSAAAEGSLLRAYSSSRHLTALAGCFWTTSANHQLRVWIGRVPSNVNPADGFSRSDRSLGKRHGWAEVPACVPHASPWAFLLPPRPQLQLIPRAQRRRLHNQGQ